MGGDEKFGQLSDGRFVFRGHVKPVASSEPDFVAVAEMFRHVPYYWGGKSVHGLDCSGLVQLALEACGTSALRDSDMQEDTLGRVVMANDLDSLKRGDLVFWDGHVGIMTDSATLLHANGHHMMVVAESLKDAVERIALRYGQITSIKRL
jgi:cell wall-associated NlpC family hydrolase